MAYQCPQCGEEYDIALFQFGKNITCPCGQIIDAGKPRVIKPEIREDDKADGDKSVSKSTLEESNIETKGRK